MTNRVRLPITAAAVICFVPLTALAQPPDDPAHMALLPVKGNHPVVAAPAPVDPDPNRPVDAPQQIVYDLNAFVTSFNAGTAFRDHANRYILGALTFGGQFWTDSYQMLRSNGKLEITNVNTDKLDGDSAEITVAEKLVPPPGAQVQGQTAPGRSWEEHLTMKRATNNFDTRFTLWKIVPPGSEPPLGPDNLPGQFLSYAAFHLAQIHPESPELPARASQSRLKAIALATLECRQDWNEDLPFNDEGMIEALWPYCQGQGFIFFIPGTRERYTFNDCLAGVPLGQIPAPAETVLFYEGDMRNLTYRYDGQAAVAFVDGHVKLITPDEAKNLIWEPAPGPR